MKHKTAELEGELLDRAVAMACGWCVAVQWDCRVGLDYIEHPSDPSSLTLLRGDQYEPSTRWDHGGPIIEREQIGVQYNVEEYSEPDQQWYAECGVFWGIGPTPLVAAMRAFVVSKLGEEVEIP